MNEPVGAADDSVQRPAQLDPLADGPDRVVCWNPSSGQRIASLPAACTADVQAAMARARSAQRAWAGRDVRSRAEALRRVHAGFMKAMPRLARIVMDEVGKPATTTIWAELTQTGHWLDWYPRVAARALRTVKRRPRLLVHRHVHIEHHPRGVVAVISPWNYPLAIPAGSIIPALLAGNAVVLKPSELSSLCGLALVEVLVDSGIDPALLQVVIGHAATAEALIDARPDQVIFTGSGRTGRLVARRAAEALVPHTLELGGKAAAIVLPGADIERTAKAIVWGACFNSGQSCVAVDRVYAVGAELEARLLAALQREIEQVSVGPPETDVEMGPLIDRRHVERAERLVADAVAKGARVAHGGHGLGDASGTACGFEPTLIVGCHESMSVMREESFGPLLPVQAVTSPDEAVLLTNDSELGLNAYVFGPRAAARSVASRLEVGMVSINNVLDHFAAPEVPWGGVKASGYGRTHGEQALRAMSQERVIVGSDLLLPREPWWFPYKQPARTWAWRLGRLVADVGIFRRLAWLRAPTPELGELEAALPRLPEGSRLGTQADSL